MAKVRKAAPAAAQDDEQTPPPAPAATKQPPMPPQQPTMAKGDEDGDEDEHDDEEDGDDEGPMDKSAGFDEAQLQGAMDLLEKAIEVKSPDARKKALLKKSYGGKLSKAENEELIGLLSGRGERVEKSLGDRVMEPIQGDDELQKAIDVSDYLTLQHDALEKSLRTVSEAVEAGQRSSYEFNMALAKSVVQQGRAIAALTSMVKELSGTPARGPKSRGAQPGPQPQARVLEKSFAEGRGEQPAGKQFSKAQILDGLEMLVMKSAQAGGPSRTTHRSSSTGEDLIGATARYEQTGRISKGLLDEVTDFIQKAQAN